ncbi:hypothetical protein L207DRAFT_639802 [Hyaloscypha variabilis F]|uniref:Uncharacterized protein n=1 Tax=Hyaloscypha variabilis (strain UAMH 11265 / GT02V1 / F) TaxID=1149755 RepID=A0A2J6R3I4_HYAVF|nr:hypothetical protein L207DRAFT_639802 [Hyaloscypha variabilis F]
MTYPSSSCATHGSIERYTDALQYATIANSLTSTSEPLTSKVESSRSQQHLSPVSSPSQQSKPFYCPITNYLEDPTASHVEPRYLSLQESTRIENEKKSFLKHLDDTLNNGKR